MAKLSAKEAAIQLGTNARTLRKFLRSKQSPIDPVGQGNRYEFDSADMKKMKKSFVAWSNGSKPKVVDAKKHAPNTPDGGYIDDTIAAEVASIEEQDRIDRTTEEVDLGDDDEPIDLEALDGPDEDDLIDIEEELDEEDLELE